MTAATQTPPPRPAAPPAVDDLPHGYELVDGRLVEKPMGLESGWVAGEVYDYLKAYCRRTGFGLAFMAEAGFQCFPRKPTQVRKPDVVVVRCDPRAYVLPRGWSTDVPTLVVEVVSPNELATELAGKVADYRSAGVPLIWVIDPDTREATVYRADGTLGMVADPGELSGEGVLPGLVVPLAAVLPPVRPAPAVG